MSFSTGIFHDVVALRDHRGLILTSDWAGLSAGTLRTGGFPFLGTRGEIDLLIGSRVTE